MGCQHSTPAPTDDDWTFCHGPPTVFLSPSLPPKNSGQVYEFSITKNSWNKKTPIEIQGDTFILTPSKDKETLVLSSSSNNNNNDDDGPIAVLKLDAAALKVKLRAFEPPLPNQSPCDIHQTSQSPLYKWAIITKRKESHQCNMMTMSDSIAFTTDFYGSPLANRKLVLQRHGLVCASFERTGSYQYTCKVGLGIDPLLIACFVASMDKISECEKKAMESRHYSMSYRPQNVL